MNRTQSLPNNTSSSGQAPWMREEICTSSVLSTRPALVGENGLPSFNFKHLSPRPPRDHYPPHLKNHPRKSPRFRPVRSSVRPVTARLLGVAVRQGRCRVKDRRKPLSGGWSESGFPPVCKMAGRACEAHMRTGDWCVERQAFRGETANSRKRRPVSKGRRHPRRETGVAHRQTLNGALGRRHIKKLSSGTFQRPGQVSITKNHGGFFRAWLEVLTGPRTPSSPLRGEEENPPPP